MRYLLDANAVIDLLNEPAGAIVRRVRQHEPVEVGISAIVVHELYYGAFRSRRQQHNLGLVDGLRFDVVDFDQEDARYAGEIRAVLAKQGPPIGSYDVLIAGQAKARDLILVTANLEEFRRVDGLQLENWSALV